ncbi:exocyst complex component SEC8 isoform X1 [Salvia hispanica]|uniref:exocyst complex component SEC8 isoform X1 n=1 Tax=Salvia hispanica TaxID=49212 RepID=UPI00200943BD|nr:exocyst complex component SEC8 isoform X1 [Salvia hispanica]XP_047971391.1 exocyst complex component SEC8 isoform X1 [Salvia hispanica]XP_047971392.1 exocyst complex component SEC8 isoform X1 [Salvia hispanica]
MSIFDGLPIPKDKSFLKEELSRIDESWAAARFDSLPHVVHILTSKDREGEVKVLKEQSDIIEEVVDEVVHAYHSGFNKAIQNYSQILRLFSESAQSLGELKVDLAQAKKLLGAHNKQLHQLWYRSVTLRHIISLLDQVEGIAKVPARIEELIAEKKFYAAVQLHVHSSLMLEREGLQAVGALQDVRTELTKLRGAFFYKVLEDLHSHLYNKGEYSSDVSSMLESDGAIPTATATSSMNYSHSLSRRTRLLKGDGDGVYRPSSVDGSSSYDGHNEDGTLDMHDDTAPNGYTPTVKANGGDARIFSRQIPVWLSDSTPDEFVEAMRKSDAPVHVKYLQTLVECLSMLGKVSAAGAIICQRLRSTIHDIITAKIKAQVGRVSRQRHGLGHTASPTVTGLHYLKGQLEHHLAKQKRQNGISPNGALAVSPVSHVMSPSGTAQISTRDLLDSILDTVVRIFENHVIVGELLESKSSQQLNMNTPKTMAADVSWSNDSDVSNDTGGFSVGFSLNVLQSECQQLICEILRATPDATSADAAVQTARLASKNPSKDKRDGSEDGLTFAFRFTDASTSTPNQGSDLNRQGWRRPNVVQEGYGTGAVLPEQGIYLAASVYRPVVQFTEKVASMLPQKFSQLGNDGLLAFTENFVKDHFLPTMFVDYRKSVQQAISSPAAFRPRANVAVSYTPSIGKGRPVLQGLLAIDCLAKEVLGWAQAMPKFAGELINYVQTFLERTYERCRTSYMEAVLEKQSYMLIGRHDVDNLLRLDPSSTCLPNSLDDGILETNDLDAGSIGVEMELSDILLNLRPIKQENLIREDNKLILLASLSDSLEYVADSIERLGKSSSKAYNHVEENEPHHSRTSSLPPKDLESFAEDYRKLAIDCLKVLRIEMQLETIFHLQEMTKREYLDDQDAEEPDDFVISLTSQITRRDEEMAPFVADVKRNYIFGGICPIAANWSIKALAEMKSINLFGVQQICRNSIALEQALAAVSSIESEVVQMRLDRVRTYYELLNMPFEALLAFIQEHEDLFSAAEYLNLLKVFVPGREIPEDAHDRLAQILPS